MKFVENLPDIIKALREGHTLKRKGSDNQFFLCDGMLVCFNTANETLSINPVITPTIGLYYEETVVQIEVGKMYMTRSGDKVFILAKGANYFYGALENYPNCFVYYDHLGKVVNAEGKNINPAGYNKADIVRGVKLYEM